MTRFMGIRFGAFSHCGAAIAVIALTLATMVGCQPGGSTKPKEPAKQAAKGSEKEAPEASGKPMTALEVLGRMVAAYRNASSYVDVGTVRLVAEADGKTIQDETVNFSLAFVRPNKLRIRAYGAEVVCDGQKLYAYRRDIPGQIFSRAAPEQLTMKNVQPDLAVMMAMTQGFAGAMPQIPLLFGKDQLDGLLRDLGEPEMSEPGHIDGNACYRVKLRGPDGIATIWIDQKTYVLRRIVLPTDSLRKAISQDGAVGNISVVADFTGAKLNGEVDPNAFKFDVPAEAKMVDFLVPPHMGQLLNKKSPDFKFTDLAGKAITSESIAGKTAVIVFWSVRYEPCRQILKNLDEAIQKYKDNPKVTFYAVCIDPPQLKDAELEKAVADLKVNVPVLRDIDMSGVAFNMSEPPVMFIINDKGIVQHCEAGVNPKFVESLQTKLDKVLAGEDIYEEPMKQYQEQVEELRQFAKLSESASTEPPAGGDGVPVKEERLPEVKTAERSEPTAFKLAPLWKCAELKMPGNILVLGGKNGPERLLVVENWRSVAEVGMDGKLIAEHKLNLDPNEVVGSLRTGVGADGKRYFVAFLMSHQRCHLFDENWNLIVNYPEDALKNPHSGISDVRLADLEGDGKLKMYVSYFGVVGVQAVSLEGKRLWTNRSDVSNAACEAIGGPDAKGRRNLYCPSHSGAIVALDAQGERRGEINVRGQRFNWIANADLRGDGNLLWCGLAAVKFGDNIAVGFSPDGDALWSHTLPVGYQPQPIERVIVGKVTRDGADQWLLPGPDGSIHIVSADGKLLDKFNYGSTLQGLATVEINGQRVLVVSSAKGLEAWKVE